MNNGHVFISFLLDKDRNYVEGICRELFSVRTLDIWIRDTHILPRWLTMFTMISLSFRKDSLGEKVNAQHHSN